MQPTLKINLETLENLFNILNEKYFFNQLHNPVITISTGKSNRKQSVYGWCSVDKKWLDKNTNNNYYEISICPEFFDRGEEEIVGTLLHEMVHLYNVQNEIRDCSRGGTYHNKKFKLTALQCGLDVSFTKKDGWSTTSLSLDSITYVKSLCIQFQPLIRKNKQDYEGEKDDGSDGEKKKRKKTRYLFCPNCFYEVKTKNEKIKLICGTCNAGLIERID